MPQPHTIVLVGHCRPDLFMLRAAVSHALPEARIEAVNDADALASHLRSDCLLLVNRALDGRFADGDGIEFIRRALQADDPPVAILISSFAPAQEQAVAAGARPGFGKSDLYDEKTAQILRDAVGA